MSELGGTRKPLLSALAAFDKDARAMFQDVADRAKGVLIRNAGADGKIDRRRLADVQEAVGNIVEGMFVDGRKVFDDDGRGLSPYARALNQRMVEATWGVLQAHQKFMHDALPEDLYIALSIRHPTAEMLVAEQGPGDEDEIEVIPIGVTHPLPAPQRGTSSISPERRTQLEQHQYLVDLYRDLRIFSPNPLAQYAWAHNWVDPNGYRLSDRIWQNAIRTRVKIDSILADGIREGMSAERMATLLERFLLPNRADLRSDKPYGRDASYDAMRLARSEITRAHSQAALLAAQRNPFVKEMNWRLSGSHKKPDICDTRAKGSPYPIDKTVPLPVQDSHPQCICHLSPGVRPQAEVTEEIRAALEEARAANIPPNITPVQAETMLTQMVGETLSRLVLGGRFGFVA